ncbi:SDR family oxidoreductase [Mycobacterium sp. 21AC1]|uniref:SDR family NAD(P)-dependent oxidoreductase n=1 Tax=[Mycobacterium] appelbergii TaxID=2939269 RepID=UPI002938EB9E|nr:SDR family oxidoreductase [Mycobacterium sp. 21AC1]MDV3127869.1 SDR family oxidoreductase [Mycobacterium sp. 21AC1]
MTEIKDRAAVVTGGGSGIGRALAIELARQGAAVGVADIMPANAERVAREITDEGGTAIALECDVCERGSIDAMRTEAQGELGAISLLIANAGATSFEPLVEMSDADVDWIVHVNLMGTLYCVQSFLPGMIAAGKGGHLLATSSVSGMFPAWLPSQAPYSSAKLGVVGLMLNLGAELAPHDINTTVYCPGGVATGMKDNNERYRPTRFGGPKAAPVRVPEEFVQDSLRMLAPEVIAPMVLRAITNDRRIVFDHSSQRQVWIDTYQQPVLDAFDVVEQEEIAASRG